MPATKSKRKIGKGDVAIYQSGKAKEGGKLNKVGVMMNIPKNVAVPGSPLPPKKTSDKPQLGEQGRGLIYTLKNRTAIEENKMERKASQKKK